MKPILDKERYLQIAADEGLSAAITELHNEMRELEHECFEGAEGYQPEIFEALKEFRDFSRELWLKNVDHAFEVTHEDMQKRRHF